MINGSINGNHSSAKNYDSEFCGSIPLHLINLIQPHGLLLVLDVPHLRIRQISENATKVLGVSAEQLLGSLLDDFVEPLQLASIRERIIQRNLRERIPVNLPLLVQGRAVRFTAMMHLKNEYAIVELEEIQDAPVTDSFIRVYQEIRYVMAALKEAQHTSEIGAIAVNEIKRLSGFDRVMLYQFDKDWNGTVIAEAREASLEPYLNLRFPASDVPRSSRELYFRNPFRLIPNREFTPVKLIPIVNPITQSFTDLSECTLRSVAQVHVEYLRNMRVMASMSTPVIINNQLWGLISCHHQTPKYVDYEMRAAFELLSSVIAVQLSAEAHEKELHFRSRLSEIHARLLEHLYHEPDLAAGLLHQSPGLLELLNVAGAAVAYEGSLETVGTTPRSEQIREIVEWLQLYNVDKVYATNTLPKVFTPGEFFTDVASGLIALPISARRGDYILGFRPEVIQTVDWGGNPNEAIRFEKDGKNYHPRNSFSIWKETVKHTAVPWLAGEIDAAENLRNAVLDRIVQERVG